MRGPSPADRVLTCGHCGAVFIPTESQWKHRLGRPSLCSSACRLAWMQQRLCKPVPLRGPCKTCGAMFHSRRDAQFCNMRCYLASPQAQEMLARNRARIVALGLARGVRQGRYVPCLACGRDVWEKPSQTRRFCSRGCYRQYMAQRFDRWLAQPQELALPQAFDEFLSQEVLPCLVKGCGWRGRHLSTHVQQAHGLPAQAFKRAAGFNLSTGLVTPDLHVQLCASNEGKGAPVGSDQFVRLIGTRAEEPIVRYRSLEAQEHARKGRALWLRPGPMRECAGCGQPFRQTTNWGRAKYCSTTCRDWWYAVRLSLGRGRKRREHHPDGTFRWVPVPPEADR